MQTTRTQTGIPDSVPKSNTKLRNAIQVLEFDIMSPELDVPELGLRALRHSVPSSLPAGSGRPRRFRVATRH